MLKNGILLIDKPAGPSSAGVVGKVKRILGARKVGHLGTLDPFASGLLPLGINDGTKVAHIFLGAEKSYAGVLTLGVETDTQDCTGRVLQVRDVPSVDERTLENLHDAFTGVLSQVPPMFSALKRNGVRLYRLARQGQSVPRTAREVKIERLRLWKNDAAEVEFELTCSKGTYVRALAADMGKFLGCGAHLKSLRRLSCGRLNLNQSVSLDELQALKDQGKLPLIPLNRALDHIRQILIDPALLFRLRLGQQDVLTRLGLPEEGEEMVRLSDGAGNLAALVCWDPGGRSGRWRLFRVFSPAGDG